jgi:23S rRNA (uracil1939-C5)-methyltransferase
MSTEQQAEFNCVHSARCGGCTLLSMPLAEQLTHKRTLVCDAFARYDALQQLAVQPVLPATPMLGYRTRAKLVVSQAGAIGLFERASHEVCDIPYCRVMHPALMDVVAAVRERAPSVLTGLDARLVHELDNDDAQRARRAGVLLTLIGVGEAEPALRELGHSLMQHPLVRGVAVRIQTTGANRMLEGAVTHIAGESLVRDHLRAEGPFHYATFGSFVQAHGGQAAAIASFVLEHLGRELAGASVRVLDLFAGSGALALELCARGLEVCAVEVYAPALAAAERAAREQGLGRLHSRAGEAEEVVRQIVAQDERFDAVIVNPPRRGLSSGLRALLPRLQARALVYVSCDPETLARDLADLAQHGWAARETQPFDMIPLSSGVETVVVLERTAPFPIRVLYEDAELLVVDKPPHLPTTPDQAHETSLLQRLQSERALPELTAVHRLDVGTSGVCLFAKQRTAAHVLAERLRGGEKHYLALVRGVIRAKGIVRVALREQGKTRPAVSRYTRVSREGSHSLVRVRPEHGRTHQVRKHMAAIKHPLLGDGRYGDGPSNRYLEHRHGLDRPFLHAARVILAPAGGAPTLTLEAPLAADLRAVLASLRRG